MWDTAAGRAEFTLDQRARIRATGVWLTSAMAAIVEFCYRAGGGSSVYLDRPLQRRLRDINAVTQHFLVRPDTPDNGRSHTRQPGPGGGDLLTRGNLVDVTA